MPRTSVNEDTSEYRLRTSVTTDTATGLVLDSSSDNALARRFTKSRQTVNTPNFRNLKKSQLEMNPFAYDEQDDSKPFGAKVITNPVTTTVLKGVIPIVEVDTSSIEMASARSSVDPEALNKSLLGLKDTKVDLSVMFGERKETGKLLLSAAGAVGNVIRDLKKGDIQGAAKHLGMTTKESREAEARFFKPLYARPKRQRTAIDPTYGLSNGWLQLQLGWKPLLQDVQNSLKALALSGGNRAYYVKKGASRRWSDQHRKHLWDNVPAIRSESGIYARTYVYKFSYDNEGLQDLSALGLTNPIATMYQLLNLSFVVDYFYNLGDFLDAWDATVGLTFLGGCTTSFAKYAVRYDCNDSADVAGQTYEVDGSSYYSFVEVRRSVLYDFPYPSLPEFDPKITFNRGLTMLSLLHQRLKK